LLLNGSIGWQWDENPWMIDKGLAHETDEEGWTYSTDFTSFSNENPSNTNISGRKGMMHFVRRRRLVRNQSFDGKALFCFHSPLTRLFSARNL
jgi:hypothetical protein